MKYEYKNTGIEWLGNIPKHWKATPIKKEFRVIPSNVDKKSADDETEVKLCNYVDVYYNDFLDSSIDYMIATANDGEIQKFKLNVNDVLITKDSEDPFDIAVPAVITEIQDNFICGYHLSMIRSINQKIDGKFLFWSLKDEAIASQLYREATGVTRWAIASRHIKNSTIPFPPLPEQRTIVNFLDKACKRIDSIIDIKQKQLENIEDMKISELYKACVKGLNSNVEYNKINIGHILDCPVHWHVKRIKRGCKKIDTGSTPKSSVPEYFEDGIIEWYGPDCFTESLILETPKKLINEQALKDNEIKIYPENSVFFVGIGASAGKVSIIRKPASCNQQINILQTNFKLLPDFLAYQFKVIEKEIIKFAQYTTLPILNQTKTGYLVFTFPPISEQYEIVKHLDNYLKNLADLKHNINFQISTLQTYRKSLIHECVTGKKQIFEGELISG